MVINLEKCIELYESGLTVNEIGDRMGFSFGSIARALRNNYDAYKGRNRYTLQERFEKYVMPEPNSGCWLWMGKVDSVTGYGYIHADGKSSFAHRISYRLHKGKIKKGMQVCHTCDVRCCVNPHHLWLGTASQNAIDMIVKGRATRAKINEEKAKLINQYRSQGKLHKEIGELVGVNYWVVRAFLAGNNYKHLRTI